MTLRLAAVRMLTFTAAATLLYAGAAHADAAYLFTVDTSPLSGQAGYIDLQFNPGGADSLPAAVDISDFGTDGALANSAVATGGASALLPGAVHLDNSTGFNDLFQGMAFGSGFHFKATLSGAALSPSQPFPLAGSAFSLSLYASDQTTPLVTTSADGSLGGVLLNPDGSSTPVTYPDGDGVTRLTVTATPVPEAGSIVAYAGLMAFGCLAVRRRR